ncbi:MAG: hypothetical protein IKF90_16075 [Parasporobacterium sp.]|nr:hypothetical protein [Parasporobacterium sp.]
MKRMSLQNARYCADLDKELVCNAIGIDEATLANWEDGTELPTIEQAFDLSKLYGMPLDLIGFSKEDNDIVYDHTALRKQILKKFGSIEAFARVIEMKPTALEKRLRNKKSFGCDDLIRIKDELELSSDEIKECFFTRYYSPLIPICKFISMLSADEYNLLVKLIAHGYKGPDLEGV